MIQVDTKCHQNVSRQGDRSTPSPDERAQQCCAARAARQCPWFVQLWPRKNVRRIEADSPPSQTNQHANQPNSDPSCSDRSFRQRREPNALGRCRHLKRRLGRHIRRHVTGPHRLPSVTSTGASPSPSSPAASPRNARSRSDTLSPSMLVVGSSCRPLQPKTTSR